MTTEAPVLELTVTVPGTPDEVWQALTDPARLACWFPPRAGGDSHKGGKVRLSWGHEFDWETNITAFEPGRHLQWMDVLPEDAEPGAILPVVDFYIGTSDRGTTVRLVHAGFDPNSDWQEMYDGMRRGWTYFLDLLGGYLQYHFQQTRDMVSLRGPSKMPRTEFWAALLGTLGMAADAAEAARSVGDWVAVQFGGTEYQAELRVEEAPHVLAVRIPDLNQASLFVELEPGGDQPTCGFWLSTYDLEADKVKELEASLASLCADFIDAQ